MDSPSPLLTYSVAEAAQATGLSQRTLRHLISTRRIPVVRMGRVVRLRPSDLLQWLEANTHPASETRR